ncbi:MAG: ABC transporter substrate-binding protein [Treponemataceae bacterium]
MKNLGKSLVVIFLIASILLVGCAKKDSSSSEKIVVKTMAYGDNANAEGQAWVRVVKAFEAENPDIKIDYELLYDEAFHQKVLARLASGDVPHLAYMGADIRWGAPWAERDQQYDMRSILDSNHYDLSKIPAHGSNGEIYLVPMGTTNATTVMFTNTRLLNELGFSQPTTYEEMIAMVPAAREAGVEVISTHGADGWLWGSCVMSSILARITGDPNWIQKAVSGERRFTDPEFVEALEVLVTMVNDGVMQEKVVLYDDGTSKSNFNGGKVLFHIGGQWEAGGFSPDIQSVMKLTPFPVLPGERGASGSVAGAMTTGYGITRAGAQDERVRDAAMKFIDFFNSEAEVIQRWRDGAIVAPILRNYNIPADMPAAATAKADIATAPTTDVIDAFLSGSANDELNAGMQKIVAGQATPLEIAEKVESLVRR